MPKPLALVAALLLILLLASCAAAPGHLLVRDESGMLDQAQIEEAAAALLARGAVVGVFVAAQGDATGDDFQRSLAAAGLLERDQIAPEVIALYVSFVPRYSELRAGTDWSARLPDAALREVRTQLLNPALREGQPGAGLAATLLALDQQLADPSLNERVAALPLAAGLALSVVALLVVILMRRPLSDWWRRSPPGRLAQWWGDQTPRGQQKLAQRLKATQQRLEQRAEYARSWCRAVSRDKGDDSAAPLLERLKQLDQERAALGQADLQGRDRERATDQLAWAYEQLGHTAARLVPSPPQPVRPRQKRAAQVDPVLGAGFVDSSSYTASDNSPSGASGSGGDTGGPSSDGGAW
jgi:uncharacterized membrane protein YgcG